MSSKRHIRKKMCERKISFLSEHLALQYLGRSRARSPEKFQGNFGIYHCPNCGKYHFGHRAAKVPMQNKITGEIKTQGKPIPLSGYDKRVLREEMLDSDEDTIGPPNEEPGCSL
jgi:hypothetical protein